MVPERYDVDIKEFETRITDGIIKGIALRLGVGYERIRKQIRDSDQRSLYDRFIQYWLAVHAEDRSAANAYFFDFKARRDALEDVLLVGDEDELLAMVLEKTVAGVNAKRRHDTERMNREFADAQAAMGRLSAGAQKNAKAR